MLLKTRVAIMQSKPCWWEQSESNSKCFCRLERRNYSTEYITELKLTDKTNLRKFYKKRIVSTESFTPQLVCVQMIRVFTRLYLKYLEIKSNPVKAC